MIKCPQCGEENQVGAIFCRGCGNKLELDKLKPDDFKKGGEETALKTTLIIIRNLFSLGILIVIGVVLVSLFLKPPIMPIQELDEKETKIAMKKFKSLIKGAPGSKHTFKVSELNVLAKLVLELTEEGKTKAREKRIESGEAVVFVPDDFYVELVPPVDVKFILKSRVYEKISLYATLIGSLNASEAGLNFTTSQVNLGRVPILLSFFQDPIVGLFHPLLEQNKKFKEKIQSKVNRIEIKSDQITFHKKNIKKKKKTRK